MRRSELIVTKKKVAANVAPVTTPMRAVDATAEKTASAVTVIVTVKVARAGTVKAGVRAKKANKIANRVSKKTRNREIRKPKDPIRARHKNLANRRHQRPPWKQGPLRLAKTTRKAKAVAAAAVVVADVIVGNVVSAARVRKAVLKVQLLPPTPIATMSPAQLITPLTMIRPRIQWLRLTTQPM